MPRVYTQVARARKWSKLDKHVPEGVSLGDPKPKRKCGKCGNEIEPGEKYREWSFRYGGTYRRCYRATCDPMPWDLTQSKMAEVYRAQHESGLEIVGHDTKEDIQASLDGLADVVEEVASEYEQAAESFGGQGENQERADGLQSWAEEIRSALDNVTDEPEACEEHELQEEDCDDCSLNEDNWLDELREAASDIISSSPY